MPRSERRAFDWRGWLALAWAAWFGLAYGAMIVERRGPGALDRLRAVVAWAR